MNVWKTQAAALALMLGSIASAGPTYSFKDYLNYNANNTTATQAKPTVDVLILGSGQVYNYNTPSLFDTFWDDNGQESQISWGPVIAAPTLRYASSAPPQNTWQSNRRPGRSGFFSRRRFGGTNFNSPFAGSDRPNPGLTFFDNFNYDDYGSNEVGNGSTPWRFSPNRFEPFPDSYICPEWPTPPPVAAVPAPGSIFLGGIGIFIVGLLRSRKNVALK